MLTNCFNTVTLASSHSTLPDDGDHTETCWSYCNFNVNCNNPIKNSLLHQLVIKSLDKCFKCQGTLLPRESILNCTNCRSP